MDEKLLQFEKAAEIIKCPKKLTEEVQWTCNRKILPMASITK
jgi:hypothetical protein